MPTNEMKRTASRAGIEDDLNKRLVPEGFYRDALNINVGRSEGSDVGAIENLPGNELIPGQEDIPDGVVVFVEEHNSKIYWAVAGNDGIYEYDPTTDTVATIVVSNDMEPTPEPIVSSIQATAGIVTLGGTDVATLSVTVESRTQQVGSGDITLMAVAVAGNGILSYRWFTDEALTMPIPGEESANLVISDPGIAMILPRYVRVRDNIGTVSATGIATFQLAAVTLSVSVADATGQTGNGDLTLVATVSGAASTPTFAWFSDAARTVPDGTDSPNLIVADPQGLVGDTFTRYLTITLGTETAMADGTATFSDVPLEFSVGVSSPSAVIGGANLIMTAFPSGASGEVTYLWYDGTDTTTTPITGETSSTISIPSPAGDVEVLEVRTVMATDGLGRTDTATGTATFSSASIPATNFLTFNIGTSAVINAVIDPDTDNDLRYGYGADGSGTPFESNDAIPAVWVVTADDGAAFTVTGPDENGFFTANGFSISATAPSGNDYPLQITGTNELNSELQVETTGVFPDVPVTETVTVAINGAARVIRQRAVILINTNNLLNADFTLASGLGGFSIEFRAVEGDDQLREATFFVDPPINYSITRASDVTHTRADSNIPITIVETFDATANDGRGRLTYVVSILGGDIPIIEPGAQDAETTINLTGGGIYSTPATSISLYDANPDTGGVLLADNAVIDIGGATIGGSRTIFVVADGAWDASSGRTGTCSASGTSVSRDFGDIDTLGIVISNPAFFTTTTDADVTSFTFEVASTDNAVSRSVIFAVREDDAFSISCAPLAGSFGGGPVTPAGSFSQAGSSFVQGTSSTATLTVASNAAWTITAGSGVTFSRTSGTNGQTTVATYGGGGSVGVGIVSTLVVGGTNVATYTVTPTAPPTPNSGSFSPGSVSFLHGTASTANVGITSSGSWTLSGLPSYLSSSSSSGSTGATITISYDGGGTASDMDSIALAVAGVNVANLGTTLNETIPDSGSLSPASLTFERTTASNATLTVVANRAWSLSSSTGFVGLTPSSGSATSGATVTASYAGGGSEGLSGTISLTSGSTVVDSTSLSFNEPPVPDSGSFSDSSDIVFVDDAIRTEVRSVTTNGPWAISGGLSTVTITPSSASDAAAGTTVRFRYDSTGTAGASANATLSVNGTAVDSLTMGIEAAAVLCTSYSIGFGPPFEGASSATYVDCVSGSSTTITNSGSLGPTICSRTAPTTTGDVTVTAGGACTT